MSPGSYCCPVFQGSSTSRMPPGYPQKNTHTHMSGLVFQSVIAVPTGLRPHMGAGRWVLRPSPPTEPTPTTETFTGVTAQGSLSGWRN